MPKTEHTTFLLTTHQDQLPPSAALPFPSAKAVADAADKSRVLALAQSLGVPIPRTVVCASVEEARARASEIGFPVVIKATRSRVWTGTKWLSTTVRYAPDAETLTAHLEAIPPQVYPILLQERIEGPGVGVFICCDEQGLIATFAHRRIREKPPSGGVSVLCESTKADPVAVEHAHKLLRALDWRGVAMVEFKRDMRDGTLRLMEINGRFWGSLQLAIDAGVDFPSLLIEMSQGRRSPPPKYEEGVRTRWLLGDLDSLIGVLFKSRARLNLPPSHPGRLRSLASFLNFWNGRTRLELERRDDMGPAVLQAKRWLRGQN
jgi:predicted ATP-grasp superfamily ATP-dependent carboligase